VTTETTLPRDQLRRGRIQVATRKQTAAPKGQARSSSSRVATPKKEDLFFNNKEKC